VAHVPQTQRQIIGRFGAYKRWAQTPDRSTSTRPARAKSPASIEYHLERLDPERFAAATDDQKLAAAEAAKKAYFAQMALKSAAARRRGGDRDANAA
jgi:hypothetical protein